MDRKDVKLYVVSIKELLNEGCTKEELIPICDKLY